MVIYEGIFLDEVSINIVESLEQQPLDQKVKNMHCTFKFRPKKDELTSELLGRKFELLLVGYGCDGKNSGFEVKLPQELQEKYCNIDYKTGKSVIPHITVSHIFQSTPKHTKDLHFEPLKQQEKIVGRFGYFMDDGTISYH